MCTHAFKLIIILLRKRKKNVVNTDKNIISTNTVQCIRRGDGPFNILFVVSEATGK